MVGMIKGGGGSGIDLSKATAGAADVRAGKKFFNVSGVLTDGTAQEIAGGNIILAGSDITLPGGKFLTGDKVVKWDSNIAADNIRSGKSIFGVNGSFTGNVYGTTISVNGGNYLTINSGFSFTPKSLLMGVSYLNWNSSVYKAITHFAYSIDSTFANQGGYCEGAAHGYEFFIKLSDVLADVVFDFGSVIISAISGYYFFVGEYNVILLG